MPFSPERTSLIKARIQEQLESGKLNDWEETFLKEMEARFAAYGGRTRLSGPQYRKLGILLKLPSEKKSQSDGASARPARERFQSDTKKNYAEPSSRSSSAIAPAFSKPNARRRRRSSNPIKAYYGVKRDIRRAMRKILIPVFLIMGLFGFFGSLSSQEGQSVQSTAHQVQPRASTSQVKDARAVTLYVTGSSVNQRSGPSTGNSVMGALTKGTPVRKIGTQGGWTQIASPLGTGWMSSRYLSSQTPTRLTKAKRGGRIVRANEIRVIDGDTVSISGERANVRLVGFNTPETYKPSCNAERVAGQRAKTRLGNLLRSANVIEFKGVACSCRPGTHGTKNCNFGRQCGSLYVDGTDVGNILISETLAERYVCGQTSCPRRQANWCR